ncbi:VWA domain-containing protein [Rhizobium sp. TRM95111]|uniref:vWA domain-containing protein n=1 Tax=Rhizobium alarense TaxID=2846851 RepID=UPI001F472EF8|nr:VWA domain-containing protein [Rhizobium alarense]MCF3640133.1 VWA domain-containing protein [Rhizobium alarense]
MRPAFLLPILFALAAPPALSAEKTIVVLDASGSMWGQIDGKAKIEIARETLGTVLKSVPSSTELGLMVYGHREKGSCGDIELAVPPVAGSAAAITRFVDGISPKGKTPISDAVQRAADVLKYTEEKATVVLVTDGLETCAADPCALASALEKQGVDFTAHVVGFGLTEEEGRQVACLAENTGGTYFEAANAVQLVAALTETVAEAPMAKPEPIVEEVAEATPEPAAIENNVETDATLSESGPSLAKDDRVRWDFFKADAKGGRTDEHVHGGYAVRNSS